MALLLEIIPRLHLLLRTLGLQSSNASDTLALRVVESQDSVPSGILTQKTFSLAEWILKLHRLRPTV
jgi:hypothetical protein